MKRSERERLKLPRPRDVDGFSRAASVGLLPAVPPSPPTRATGVLVPSANEIFRTGMVKFLSVSAIYAFFVFGVLEKLAMPSGVEVAFLMSSSLGWLVLMMRTLRRPGQRALDEMIYGYSTLASGGPNYSSSSEHSWGEGGPPWDYSGVWLLDREFGVKSVPNLQVDPPGFYPSPHRAGQWELWTGAVWSGVYRSDPWPRTRLSSATSWLLP